MKQIPITKGLFALVDDCDFDELSRHRWFAKKGARTFYAARWGRRKNGKRSTIWMHREVIGQTDSTKETDHIDGNGLNNCRVNLRPVSRSQNMMNRRMGKKNNSGFKGVHWCDNWFYCHIRINGKHTYLGIFKDPKEAANTYDKKAIEVFGQFAKTNKMLGLL